MHSFTVNGATYNNEILNGEIKCLKDKRKELLNEIKLLDNEITEKRSIYNKGKTKYYFEKGLCGICFEKLTEYEITNRFMYCEDCVENDSALEWKLIREMKIDH